MDEAELNGRAYRLRLVLPELPHAVLGSSITSPPPFLQGDVNLFDEPKVNRYGASKNLQNTASRFINNNDSKEAVCASKVDRSIKFTPDTWPQVGALSACKPAANSWEFGHKFKDLAVQSCPTRTRDGHWERARMSSFTEEFPHGSFNRDDATYHDKYLSSTNALRLPAVQEADLVIDAVYAFQGIPAAVAKLERLCRSFSSTAADNSHKLTSFWTRSTSSAALAKLLSVIARAGRLRCLLEAFVGYFLDERPDLPSDDGAWSSNMDVQGSWKKQRKKGVKRRTRKSDEKYSEHSSKGGKTAVAAHCLVNQAFAAAVRSILRGHSAALNTLSASVMFRRRGLPQQMAAELERDTGPALGHGCRDISLLEFYLHTRELRVQLQALAFLCLKDGNLSRAPTPLTSGNPSNISKADIGIGLGNAASVNILMLEDNLDSSRSGFENFPRGADLLSYLYQQLMEVDPLNVELLQFLFERSYRPYAVFIRSWLYQATVEDPYKEFVIEEADKMRSGVYAPIFLETVCTPLMRAGQQLQVLQKLPATSKFAQLMGKLQVSRSDSNLHSVYNQSEELGSPPVLVFNRSAIQKFVQDRERESEVMRCNVDELFDDLAYKSLQAKEKGKSVRGTVLSPDLSTLSGSPLYQEEDVDQVLSNPQSEVEQKTAVQLVSWKLQSKGDFNLQRKGNALDTVEGASTMAALSNPSKLSGDLFYRAMLQGDRGNLKPLKGLPPRLRCTGNTEDVIGAAKSASMTKNQPNQEIRLSESYNNNLDFPQLLTKDGSKCETRENFCEPLPLLSGQEQGSSWPILGLPTNPFSGLYHQSVHAYKNTSFSETYQHWDVSIKFARKENCPPASVLDLSTSSNKDKETESVEPPWFQTLQASLENQLYAGLSTQLSPLVSLSRYSVILEEEAIRQPWSSFGSTKQDSILDAGLDDQSKILTCAALQLSDCVEEGLERPGSLLKGLLIRENSDPRPFSADLVKLSEKTEESKFTEISLNNYSSDVLLKEVDLLDDGGRRMSNKGSTASIAYESEDTEVEDSNLSVSDCSRDDLSAVWNSIGMARWEQHLQFSSFNNTNETAGTSYQEVCREEKGAKEAVPLLVVISKCIVQEILWQYPYE